MTRENYRSLFLIVIVFFMLRLLFIVNNDLLVEEAYYWNYSRHLDFSYLDHPPMVAWCIKLGTLMFGTNEWAVRFAAIPCWLITAFFSFRLSNLVKPGTGIYAIVLLSVLPFFFIHAMIITPDIPLITSWSASLYYLYKALVLEKAKAWYWAGFWLGLGLLSKYTIVLVALATFVYMIIVPVGRKWFLRKEPYLGALIATCLFSPVIYWNASHQWISFFFQSTQRLEDSYYFSFHELLGLFILFLTPVGAWGAVLLFRGQSSTASVLKAQTRAFLQIFTCIPLLVFSLFSLLHDIKFNWIGPSLLAVVPWLSALWAESKCKKDRSLPQSWYWTIAVLFMGYAAIFFSIYSGRPADLSQSWFRKFISWSGFTRQVQVIAKGIESKYGTAPVIIPLDTYNIASELSFYQSKFLENGSSEHRYLVVGQSVFGMNSLMYQYWSNPRDLEGKLILLISREASYFSQSRIKNESKPLSDATMFWSYNQNGGTKIDPYFYQLIRMKAARAVD